jgi:hypothetical protein
MYQIAPPSKINPVVPMGPCGYSGVGCAGMGGLTMDGSGLFGTGLFSSSDLASWGTGELIAVGFGLFVLYSVFSTTSRAASKVRRKVKYVAATGKRRRQAKAASLREQVRALEYDGGRKKKSGGLF